MGITWIELLPKDCVHIIRTYLCKYDYENVIDELSIETHDQRTWIENCESKEDYAKNFTTMTYPYAYGNIYTRNYCVRFPLDVLRLYIENVFVAQQDYINMNKNEREVTEILLNKLVNTKLFHSNSELFIHLYRYIEYHIDTVHNLSCIIAERYRDYVALPNEFISRMSMSNIHWTDTEQSFKRYLNEDAVFINYRAQIKEFFELIDYNCGHLRKVRDKVAYYKEKLYQVRYKRKYI